MPVDRFIFERYFPDTGIMGTFVECGAFDGLTECSCKFFEETMGWSGYNLEPVPWIFETLQANRPKSRNLNCGLSDTTRDVQFQSVVHPKFGRDTTIGSIEHTPGTRDIILGEGCSFEAITVQVRSWSDFIAREAIEEIDLMVLDVEGHELCVLSGMKGSKVIPKIMCVEFGHIGFGPLRATMADLGYDYDISSHANAFFIRRDTLALFAFRAGAGLKIA
jgi:FkbM family methyltransferase